LYRNGEAALRKGGSNRSHLTNVNLALAGVHAIVGRAPRENQYCPGNFIWSQLEAIMRLISSIVATLMCAGVAAPAHAQSARLIRGEIVSVDGAILGVKTRSGENIQLRLKEGQPITAVIPAALSDIKPGVFVGAAAMPGKDGALTAMEVHIFPEAQRGFGEGFRPFDLAPGSSMTNANIAAAIDTVDGPKLTLTYKGGEQTILVDKATPIVTFAPGGAADLKPGASIDIFGAAKASDGVYEAPRVLIGRDGTKVPM
jgi:hypothetical protein